jgi:hypothetical protein
MNRRNIAILGLILFVFSHLYAVERTFESGKILSVETKQHTRILYYLVNTPITQDDPYYEVTVRVNDVVYVGDYTPVHPKQRLPDDWRVDGLIQARAEKHRIFLKQPGEPELQLIIVKQTTAAAAPDSAHGSNPKPC